MNKNVLEFGDAMGIEVAFSNIMTIDLTESARMAWVSGQIAFNEENEIVGHGNMATQTEQCIKNIESALKAVGGTLDDIVKVMIFVTDMTDLKDIHNIRLKYFNKPYPTSTLVKVAGFVNPNALIEIQADAVININK